jgi:hypothetical protein
METNQRDSNKLGKRSYLIRPDYLLLLWMVSLLAALILNTGPAMVEA